MVASSYPTTTLAPRALVVKFGLEIATASATEIRLKVCPFCGGKNDFVIHAETGVFICHKCGEKGNAVSLARQCGREDLIESGNRPEPSRRPIPARPLADDLPHGEEKPGSLPDVDACHAALLECGEVISWLTDRGIDENPIRHFRLGVCDRGGEPWLVIPHVQDGVVRNAKYRSIRGEKRFARVTGRPSVLFNCDVIQQAPAELFIVEGECDTLIAHQIGLWNTVGLTSGAGRLDPEWFDQLDAYQRRGGKIILLCDNDTGRPGGKNPGQEGAHEIARRLGIDRVRNYILPDDQKDLNDWFVFAFMKRNMALAEIGPWLRDDIARRARPFNLRNAVGLAEVIERMALAGGEKIRVDRLAVIDFDDDSVNELFRSETCDRGFLPLGTLSFLMAPPKTGKTTFGQQVTLHNAGKDLVCFDYCLEMSPRAKAQLYMTQYVGHPPTFSPEEFERIKTRLSRFPIIVGHNETGANPKTVLETIDAVVSRYGCKMVILDNLQFCIRGRDEYQRLSEFTIQLKESASRNNVALLVICQPNIKGLRHGQPMDYSSIKTASDAAADCDFFMILQRDPLPADSAGDAVFSNHGTLKVISRESRGGTRPVWFDERARRFVAPPSDRQRPAHKGATYERGDTAPWDR